MSTKPKNWMDEQKQRNADWDNFIALFLTLFFVFAAGYGAGRGESQRMLGSGYPSVTRTLVDNVRNSNAR